MKDMIIPIAIIVVGVGWLLATMEVMPGVVWPWTLGLAAAGVIAFVAGGWNKLTVVVGPLLIAASIFSVLRQTGRMSFDHEVPILVILLGVLLLVAQSRAIPPPEWIVEQPK